jgi:nucleolar MIF4G domain-containing protein 1
LVKEQADIHSINLEDSTSNQSTFNLRAKFMIQTIYDLKNNKQRSNEDNSNMLQIKKSIRSILNKRGIQGENTLRVSMSELLNAKDKGRWWIVGSAWAGNGPSSAKEDFTHNDSSFDSKILTLAKEHHMSTDIRRAIFCTIMSSEDYVDAFEKLMKLNLKGKQDREIVSILVYCSCQEKKFNEFYAHLSVKFCTLSHSFRFTFQTAFWDKFKEIDSLSLRSISNLSTLLSKLVATSALSLSLLKVIYFA